MMLYPGQLSPNHFHWHKMEDIINRGGGTLGFRLWNADRETERMLDTAVRVFRDGRRYTVPAGSEILLQPGESLTLYPYCYHEFFVPAGSDPVLIGEVSMCNDDEHDNRFLGELPRFPDIEEDEPAYRLLCMEYPKRRTSASTGPAAEPFEKPSAGPTTGYDELFLDIGRYVTEQRKPVSIGMLQRRFQIGFNRAAHVVDQLADAGIVSPDTGGRKAREVLMSADTFRTIYG